MKAVLGSAREGNIRGAQQRIQRDEQPTAFWFAVVVWTAVSLGLVIAGVSLW